MRYGQTETATIHPKLEQLVRESSALGASDLFLVPGEPLTLRVGGRIQRTEGEILSAAEISEMAIAAFDAERLAKFGTDFPFPQRMWMLPGEEMLVRMNVTSSLGDHTIHVQLSRPEIADVHQLRVPEAVLKAALSSSGLIFFSGKWESGKSTTAHSVVDYINANRACQIYTVEDPVYVRFTPKKALVRQCEIWTDAPSVAWALGTMISQEIDVLYVPLIKDLESLEVCIACAEKGYLVISEMLMQRPQDLIERIVEAYPENQQQGIAKVLARTLGAVCCQKLIPGTNGRLVPAYAVLIPDEEMRKAIAEGRDPMRRDSPMPPECQTMEQAIRRLLEQGDITAETAERTLSDIQ